MTRVRRVVAVLVTVLAVGLATTAQTGAHASTPTAAGPGAAAKPATTALHLHITGCDTCRITPQQAITDRPHVWTSPARTVGGDHVVSWKVPTQRTLGMSFVLSAPWAGNTGSVPNLVTRYAGADVDTRVTEDQAMAAGSAAGCWSGTTQSDVRLDFRVERIRGKDVAGDPTTLPLAYATHTMASWEPMSKTYRGTIGNQDAFYCTAPPTTKVTLTTGCEGCQIQLLNGARRLENAWQSPTRTVSGGQVTFRVPRPRTAGLTASVYAPWEGVTGYQTLVVLRYRGHQPPDAVNLASARHARRGSPCWAGTDQDAVRIALTVAKVRVGGAEGETDGTIAFTTITQDYLPPMVRTYRGVLGTQEVVVCRT